MRTIRHEMFGKRWPAFAASDTEDVTDTPAITIDQSLPHVLIIDDAIPMYDKYSGALRMDEMLQIIKECGFAVTFIPSNLRRLDRYTQRLQAKGIRVLGRPLIRSIHDHLQKEGDAYDLVIVSRPHNMAVFASAIKTFASNAKLVFDSVDLHFLRLEREAGLKNSAWIAREAKRYEKMESKAIRSSHHTIAISEEERSIIKTHFPDASVFVIGNIHDIRSPINTFEKRDAIAFIGNFTHSPNVDAAVWLSRDIWPLIRKFLPDAKLIIVGDDPEKKLAGISGEGIDIKGYVSDLDMLLEECKMTVAPLRYGAGVKGKIHMSLSRGVPVIGTTVAIEGMHMQHEYDCLTADTSQNFADAAIRLYGDKALWSDLSSNGVRIVEEYASKEAAKKNISNLISALIEKDKSDLKN
jgi:O-antigen biosynthesis protein